MRETSTIRHSRSRMYVTRVPLPAGGDAVHDSEVIPLGTRRSERVPRVTGRCDPVPPKKIPPPVLCWVRKSGPRRWILYLGGSLYPFFETLGMEEGVFYLVAETRIHRGENT